MKRVLFCAALVLWSGIACAVVYKWVDAQGKLQYGDRPPDGVHAELVDMPGSRSSPPSSNSVPGASSSAPAGAPKPTATATTDDSARKAVDDDVAQAREKQCSDAQDRYKKLIEGRKLYKAGPDGERQYLTSEEIDAERLSAKHDVDSICNSPS